MKTICVLRNKGSLTLLDCLRVLRLAVVPYFAVTNPLTDGHTFESLLVLAVQELVDFEHIDGIEWSQESEDEEDENVEGMDVVE